MAFNSAAISFLVTRRENRLEHAAVQCEAPKQSDVALGAWWDRLLCKAVIGFAVGSVFAHNDSKKKRAFGSQGRARILLCSEFFKDLSNRIAHDSHSRRRSNEPPIHAQLSEVDPPAPLEQSCAASGPQYVILGR